MPAFRVGGAVLGEDTEHFGALEEELGVLHYDDDYDILRMHTPLEFRSVWITQRGSVP